MTQDVAPLAVAEIRRLFGVAPRSVSPLGAGLINQTFLVTTIEDQRYVLQRLHEIFPAAVNEDMEAVTSHLVERGLATPRLVRTVSGDLWVDRPDGVWRMMTYVPGVAVERVESEARALEAGRLLGRFHAALADLDHQFAAARAGIHDTARHLSGLRSALDRHRDHPEYQGVLPLARSILDAAVNLAPLPDLPGRVVHGDPKISNFIFDSESGTGICIVDLDTLNRMPLPLELGDALRSWCNPAGEDVSQTGFSISFFRAALAGYGAEAGRMMTPAERACVVEATLAIMVELAARFCADALNESYFSWDATRFASRSEHNRVRAEGQMAAWRACRARAAELGGIVEEVLGGSDA